MVDIDLNSPAAHNYINILQSTIGRMAANSSSCKTWCITIVSAIIIISVNNQKPNILCVAFIPALLFFFVDSYYLGLEKSFRDNYERFIKDLKEVEKPKGNDRVFDMIPKNKRKNTLAAFCSISTIPFYGVLAITLMITRCLIL